MRRILSWLTLIGCYMVFCFVIGLDMMLLNYLTDLYFQLSPFLKIVVIILGGSTILGLALTPLFYGIPLTYSASEAVHPSKKGTRYSVMGVLIILSCISSIINDFQLSYIFIGIYGIALVIYGQTQPD